jgi:nitric oxide reductase activation protein
MAQMGQMPGSDPMGMPGGASTGGRSGGRGQQMPQQQQPSPIAPEAGPNDGKLEHDQAKLRNMDRQKQIVSDTQKLVALANELQADVQKSNKDTLSLDVIRKADEIEKLAKSVREKMKGS